MAEDKTAIADKVQKYLTKSDWGNALTELQKLNTILKGQDLRVRMKIAEMLAKTGSRDEAVKEYIAVAESYAEKGFTVQAIAVNKVIVKLDPSREDIHKKLAELQGEKGFIPQVVPKTPVAAPKEEIIEEVTEEVIETGKKQVPRTPLFSELTPDELAYLSQKVNAIQALAGSAIFKEGDSGDSIFIITHGEVKIVSKNSKGEEVEVAKLKDENFFGEFAYFSNSKRHASAIASADTELLELTRDILSGVTEKYPRITDVLMRFYKNRVVDKLMATSQLFKNIGPKDRMEILQKFSYHTFAPGALIIQEGCAGDYLYLIKSGKADITTWREDQEMLLATIGEGEFFGEISLVTGAPRTASVRARVALEAMRLSKADLDEVASKHQHVKKAIDDVIKKRVEDTIKTVLEMKRLWEAGLV
ncbi:MAG: cyclic nucleotide-binding domain-containing protein [Deltaproteobacteria bacterium]